MGFYFTLLPAMDKPSPTPRAIVFDAYGTLFDVHSVVAACEALFPGEGRALSQLWRTKQLEYSWLRSLMGRYVDFNVVTQDALQYACASLRLEWSEATSTTLNDAYRRLSLFDDTRATLEQLRARQPSRKLAILSNGAPDMLNAVVTHNGLMFDLVLSAFDAGVFKPDPAVYRLACQRLDLPPAEIAFVSSNGWDAAGAKAFGFTTYWINRTGAPGEALGLTPDRQLATLSELLAL